MDTPQGQKQFECEHCQAAILVPADLPATSAPCPVCQQITTSPPPEQRKSSFPATPVSQQVKPAPPVDNSTQGQEESSSRPSGGGSGLLWGLAGLIFFGLLVAVFFLFGRSKDKSSIPEKELPAVVAKARPGFEKVEEKGVDLLNKFLAAETVEERAQYVIGKEKTIPDMKAYYGGGSLDQSELRSEFFSEWIVDHVDTSRGIFLLEYDRPKQIKLSEHFPPIADLKTRLNLREPDAQLRSLQGNFEMEAERARVFLKIVDGELLIDWHTYVQTKDRLFRDFIEYPVAGRKKIFRLGISEDASTLYEDNSEHRNYRLIDPAHAAEDNVVVTVNKNSKVGKILEELAWTDVVGKGPISKSATLEIQWSSDIKPKLQIAGIICWEFLGVGGDPSNLAAK